MSDWTQIHALADNELSGPEREAAETRLASCTRSRAEYENVRALQETLKSKCEPLSCDATWAKCRSRLQEMDNVKRVEKTVNKYAWALCGVFFVALLAAGVSNRLTGPRLAPGDVARTASMSPLSLPSLRSPEEKRQWIQDVFGRPVPVQPGVIQVTAARKGVVNGAEVMRVDMVDTTGPLSLFITATPAFSESPQGQYASVLVNTTNGVAWQEAGFSLMLLGDREPAALERAADAVRGR